jgi:hypothetical protein
MTRHRGEPLSEEVRRNLEEFFGEDLRTVRLHTGAAVAAALATLRVDGVVFGRRIYLSPDAAALCAAGGSEGAAFLAHEVCHVLQYRRHGFWPFLGRYVAGFLRKRRYARIPFEVEAFEIERAFADGRRPARVD